MIEGIITGILVYLALLGGSSHPVTPPEPVPLEVGVIWWSAWHREPGLLPSRDFLGVTTWRILVIPAMLGGENR